MPDWISVIILGLIEGLTEFLPVSSTGHLLLVQNTGLLPRQNDVFNVVIQCGAVLAVLAVFAKRAKTLATTLDQPETRSYLGKLCAAFVITAIGGLSLKRVGFDLEENPGPVAWATLIGGILILIVERALAKTPRDRELTWTIAAWVGVAQLVAAVLPGTSRSGATILIAIAFGVSRWKATEFSFLLGIPSLLAAGGLEIFSALRDPAAEPINWSLLALGTAVSAITAFIVVRWLLRYVQTHTFVAFGWYRIVLGGAILLLLTQ